MLKIYDDMLDGVRSIRGPLVAIEKRDLDLARQLRRAASSVVLNVAEGSGSFGRVRTARYRTALSRARRARACASARRSATSSDARRGHERRSAASTRPRYPNASATSRQCPSRAPSRAFVVPLSPRTAARPAPLADVERHAGRRAPKPSAPSRRPSLRSLEPALRLVGHRCPSIASPPMPSRGPSRPLPNRDDVQGRGDEHVAHLVARDAIARLSQPSVVASTKPTHPRRARGARSPRTSSFSIRRAQNASRVPSTMLATSVSAPIPLRSNPW